MITKFKKIIGGYWNLSIQIKAAIWYTICNMLQKGISFIAIPIYTRILTPEQYGLYSVFLSWIDIFDIITTFRISGGGYIAGLTKYKNDKNHYCSSLQSLEITITTIFLLFYLAFREKVNSLTGLTFTSTILIFILMYAMPAISFWTARQRVEYRYLSVISVTLLISFFIPFIGITWALNLAQRKELGIIGGRVVIQGLIGIVLIVKTYRKSSCFFNYMYWKKTLCFNIPLLPYYLSTIILQSSDRIIINLLINPEAAGIYGVAYSMSMVMQLFSSSIHASLQPWLFNQLEQKYYKNIPGMINELLLFIAVINLLVIALAPEILFFMAPPAYYEAVWIIPPLASSVFIMFFYEHFINVEIFLEESRNIAIASISAAILNILLNLVFIPVFGYLAAGYTTLISYVIFCVTHYFYMIKICKKNRYPDNIFDIINMIKIGILFFFFVFLLTLGYKYRFLRYSTIICLTIFAFSNKNKLSGIIQLLKK